MILRILRAPVLADAKDAVVAHLRDEAIARALVTPGLRSFHPGLRRVGDGLELIIVTTWDDIESVLAVQQPLDSPVSVPGIARFLGAGRAQHYELVVNGSRSIPIVGAVVRLLWTRLKQNVDATYFGGLRELVEPLLDNSSLLALHVGRQASERGSEAVSVTVWSSEEALEHAARGDVTRPIGEAEAGELAAEPAIIEQFRAVTVTTERPDAPALLLADDERRYFYATPAASEVLGRSVSRLIRLRVEDIASADLRPTVPEMWRSFMAQGRLDGPFTVERPDGSHVDVHYSARVNVPWRGCHASLLVPVDAPERPDIDAALVAAGVGHLTA